MLSVNKNRKSTLKLVCDAELQKQQFNMLKAAVVLAQPLGFGGLGRNELLNGTKHIQSAAF